MTAAAFRPLMIDLFCGVGGWSAGGLAEGYNCVGFDIERHRYPARDIAASGARKVQQNGVDFNNPNVGSSVNRSFNYANEVSVRDAPLIGGWIEYPAQLVIQDVLTLHGSQFKDATLIVASPPCQAYSYRAMPWKRAKALPPPDNTLFEACFRIQREASAAAGRHVPLVVENVRGAQKWVGRARWMFGSYALWGDVPALMPLAFNATKLGNGGETYKARPAGFSANWANRPSSHSVERRAQTAMIAKIPLELSTWVARCFKPTASSALSMDAATLALPHEAFASGGTSIFTTPESEV